MIFYYIVPAITEYEQNDDEITTTIRPAYMPAGCTCDCVDGVNFLVMTELESPEHNPLSELEFNDSVSAIGFDPLKVKLWGGA